MTGIVTQTRPQIEHAYGASEDYTVGVEEEFALIDPQTGDLISRAHELMELAEAGESHREGRITHELMQSVIESSTGVCSGPAHALEQLTVLRRELSQLGKTAGYQLAAMGTHPFAQYSMQQVTDKPRYRELVERLQWVARRELIFGLHVHVGVDSPEKAIYVMNGMRAWLPELLGLSVNSPFWQGTKTGLMSSRVNVFQSFPRSGVPDVFGSWDEWATLIRHAQRAGVLKDHTYLWWDVRLAPAFGTVEIRIMDAQTSINATTALTALVQACAATLGAWFDEGRPQDCPPTMLVEENKWRAARFGLGTTFVPYGEGDHEISAVESAYRLLDLVMPAASRLGTTAEIAGVERLIERSGAAKQLETYGLTGDLASVVDQLVTDSIA